MRVDLQGFQVPQKRFNDRRGTNTPHKGFKRQDKPYKPFKEVIKDEGIF